MKNKKETKTYNIAEMQPDEINALRAIVKEYVSRKQTILNEQETLKEDLKTLDVEFAAKLDLKHLKLAEKYFNLQASVIHRDTFDLIVETLQDPSL